MADDSKAVLRRAAVLRDRIRRVLGALAHERGAATEAVATVRAGAVAERLAAMPVERLREVTDDRLRIAPVRDAGYLTVLDVCRASVEQLDAAPNVGATTAAQVHAAARRLARAVEQATPVRLDPDRRTDQQTDVLRRVDRYDRVRRATASWRADASDLEAALTSHLDTAAPARSTLRMVFTFGRRRRAALDAVDALDGLLAGTVVRDAAPQLDVAEALLVGDADPPAAELWAAYERNAATFGATVERLLQPRGARAAVSAVAAHGFVPEDIVEQIAALDLDETHLRVALRGYQEFGAKFALVQRRVILGDEMGLGKTVQAIAAMAHLRAQGHRHFAVVCPATVLVNWVHEIARHSDLVAHRVHGDQRDAALVTWARDGGVAVTTFETLRRLDLLARPVEPVDDISAGVGEVPVAMVVVDEAHYVKQGEAMRSRAVQALVARVGHALLMTGTPMENRPDEFCTLVSYLRPDLAASLDPAAGAAGADSFRRAVAPVYLRRNQIDVLAELPERVESEDWVELTPDDLAAYRDAVASENFMAMRRAAFAVRDVERSAKLERLAQILADAAEDGHKVLVFSFFLDVLDAVRDLAGADAHGPLTGAVPPVERQAIVDRFSAVDGYAVLVSQIQAGGVGLNVQAASVVVLTEPQWKPSAEDQAIARAHRMGQTRVVQVHRLLAEASVDELMIEVVRHKRALFDLLARESVLKDASAEAIDVRRRTARKSAWGPPSHPPEGDPEISDAAAAKAIIAAERRRLGLPLAADAP